MSRPKSAFEWEQLGKAITRGAPLLEQIFASEDFTVEDNPINRSTLNGLLRLGLVRPSLLSQGLAPSSEMIDLYSAVSQIGAPPTMRSLNEVKENLTSHAERYINALQEGDDKVSAETLWHARLEVEAMLSQLTQKIDEVDRFVNQSAFESYSINDIGVRLRSAIGLLLRLTDNLASFSYYEMQKMASKNAQLTDLLVAGLLKRLELISIRLTATKNRLFEFGDDLRTRRQRQIKLQSVLDQMQEIGWGMEAMVVADPQRAQSWLPARLIAPQGLAEPSGRGSAQVAELTTFFDRIPPRDQEKRADTQTVKVDHTPAERIKRGRLNTAQSDPAKPEQNLIQTHLRRALRQARDESRPISAARYWSRSGDRSVPIQAWLFGVTHSFQVSGSVRARMTPIYERADHKTAVPFVSDILLEYRQAA